MRWIVYVAVSLAVLRPATPPFLLPIAPLCWMLLVYELTHALFPLFFRMQPLHVFLVGDRMGRNTESNAVLPWMDVEELSDYERVFSEAGFSLDAALFILSALRTLNQGPPPKGEGHRASKVVPDAHHVTAAELCAAVQGHAASLVGNQARVSAYLGSLGLRRGEDVGRVVMKLVDIGWIGRLQDEKLEDFCGLTIDPGLT
jgi:uncharacterized repeat protein (TIGR04138 family)